MNRVEIISSLLEGPEKNHKKTSVMPVGVLSNVPTKQHLDTSQKSNLLSEISGEDTCM
jgi:hypothetical protein